MEDTSREAKTLPGELETALTLGRLLREHKGGEVTVLDLRELNSWTSFFVIATVTSHVHRQGLERHIKDFAREQGLEIIRRSRRPRGDAGLSVQDEWCLVDMGNVVIHLMSSQVRSFYELERLWSAASPLEF
jgi:ribosome-associated protein